MSTITFDDAQRPRSAESALFAPPTITYPGKLTSSDDEHGPRKVSAVQIADDGVAVADMLPISLTELISELSRIFAVDKVDIDEVRRVMQRYKSNRADWQRFAKFDPHRYTRNLVDVGNGKYNLMLLAWGENQGSSVHDHSGSHCFMKILDGELHEQRYDFPARADDPLRMKQEDVLKRNEVCYINDSIGLHRVENSSHTDKAVSLHLYIPPFQECHTFDERTGKVNSCRVTFWSQFGERTPFQRQVSGRSAGNDDPTSATTIALATVDEQTSSESPTLDENERELI